MITLKQNDTGVGLKAILSNNKGNINLTGSDVLFLFDAHEINADIVNAEDGEVNVILNKLQTSRSGEFYAEFKVRFSDGRIETFPNNSYLRIKIMKSLGGD